MRESGLRNSTVTWHGADDASRWHEKLCEREPVKRLLELQANLMKQQQ